MGIKETKGVSELLEICEYDDRDPDFRWCGHIGHSNLDGEVMVLFRSWASPREGCNPEKILVKMAGKRVRIYGHDDCGRDLDYRFQPTVSMGDVVAWMLVAARSGKKAPESLYRAAIDGATKYDW